MITVTIEDIVVEATKDLGVDFQNLTLTKLAKWLIEKNKVDVFKEAIDKEPIIRVLTQKKYRGKLYIEQILNLDVTVGSANALRQLGHQKQAEEIFTKLLQKTKYDSTVLNDYSVLVMKELMEQYNNGLELNEKRLELCKSLASKALIIDHHLCDDSLKEVSKINMCTIRVLEAISYFQKEDRFTSFVLGWMSIEMILSCIWYRLLRCTYYSKDKIDSLQRWNIDTIMEVLLLKDNVAGFKSIKPSLDTLKGTRNDLLHGTIFEVTKGQARSCIEIAYKLLIIYYDMPSHEIIIPNPAEQFKKTTACILSKGLDGGLALREYVKTEENYVRLVTWGELSDKIITGYKNDLKEFVNIVKEFCQIDFSHHTSKEEVMRTILTLIFSNYRFPFISDPLPIFKRAAVYNGRWKLKCPSHCGNYWWLKPTADLSMFEPLTNSDIEKLRWIAEEKTAQFQCDKCGVKIKLLPHMI